jgi:Zn-finger nucleic acid-binding protein
MNEPEKDKSQRQIKLLQVLAEDCRKHPSYRARRAATKRCPECVVVWKARCELNEFLSTH